MSIGRISVYTSFTSLSLLLAAACTSFGDASDRSPTQVPSVDTDTDAGDGPKAPAVTETPSSDQITELHGIFVAPSGDDKNAGTRVAPLASVQTAIASAARVGKIVFACTGTYKEALVVSDSISVIGGMDCSDPNAWRAGSNPSRIESPTSPAIVAKSVTSATRLESLDVIAPNATDLGASSIGLFADHSTNLTIATSKITAGSGANGTNGTEGTKLTPSGNATGGDGAGIALCGANPCLGGNISGGAPGTNACLGGSGSLVSQGGLGGVGGIWQLADDGRGDYIWQAYQMNGAAYGPGSGAAGKGAGGVPGNDAAPASEIGSLTADGYVPANGSRGGDGSLGTGGRGGNGGGPEFLPDQPATPTTIYRGGRGAGGGAGGCPGLAGTPGTGGGASLGVALLESPIILDGVTIKSSGGGLGGLGTFGSDPSPGAPSGGNLPVNSVGTPLPALPGGNGGVAGVSTNGSNGPSIGVLVSGAAPIMKGTTTATPGSGAPAINERTYTATGINVLRTIPATPAGLSVDIKTL